MAWLDQLAPRVMSRVAPPAPPGLQAPLDHKACQEQLARSAIAWPVQSARLALSVPKVQEAIAELSARKVLRLSVLPDQGVIAALSALREISDRSAPKVRLHLV